MSDETATKPVKAKKKNYYQEKVEKLEAQLAEANAKLETKSAVEEHFAKLPDTPVVEAFVDEHDRAKMKHREQIEEAKERGVDPEEVIEYGLDSSEVRPTSYKGKVWLQEHHLRWVNNVARGGARISYHKGKGYFIVRPSKHEVRPTHGIKEEDAWIFGENILMAEPMDIFLRNRKRAYEKMVHQGQDMREGTREAINALIRDETGQPKAQPGITKSYRDNTWDRVEEGSPIVGPSASTITPTQ